MFAEMYYDGNMAAFTQPAVKISNSDIHLNSLTSIQEIKLKDRCNRILLILQFIHPMRDRVGPAIYSSSKYLQESLKISNENGT